MRWIMDYLKVIVNTIDKHEGTVALIGIAITVIIFLRELSNNFFTMERDTFNEIFKEPVMRQLPNKLSCIEEAKKEEWHGKFDELMEVVYQIDESSKYFKYSIPFFHRCLGFRITEISDLVRHDNWRLYRSTDEQNRLIQKKCRLLIRDINNASKGRVFVIKCFQDPVYQKFRKAFLKQWVDHPIDRLLETYVEDDLSGFELFNQNKMVDTNELKHLKESELIVKAKNSVHLAGVHIVDKGKCCFGYKYNVRWGKNIGITTVKGKKDKTVKVFHRPNAVQLLWDDFNRHTVVLLWYEENDKNHIHFVKFRIQK